MASPGDPREGRRAKILYIEDDPESRALVRNILESAGYSTIEAEDGLSGIEIALREHPALVLLDIRLPDVDGYTVAAILRTFPKLASAPIVGVTAYALAGDRERTLVAGCDGYVTKPIDVDLFPTQIAEFIRGKRERILAHDETFYLRELNQRFVCHLLRQIEESKRLNQRVMRRARQLESIHRHLQDLTSEIGTVPLLERLLPSLAEALGAAQLVVELNNPPGTRVAVGAEDSHLPAGSTTVEWKFHLELRGEPCGFIMARYVQPGGDAPEDEHLFRIVAHHVAVAVENSRLYEETDAARQRAAFLAEASATLASSLDYQTTLESLARLAVPTIADVCFVDVLDEDARSMRRVAVFAGAPEKQAAATVLQRYAPDLDSPFAIVDVLRSGTPRVLPDVADAELVSIARNAEHLEAMRTIAPRSVMLVPLAARGRTLGVMAFVSTGTARRYGPADLVFAQDLTSRAALALDNARLYREAQETDRRKDRFLAVLAHELRNPLAPIVAAMGIIRHHEAGNAAVQRARAIVERQVAYQARLLDDLLDLSRIGRDKVEVRRSPVELRGLLYDVVETLGATIRERDLRLAVEMPGEPIVLMADTTRLEQIFVNLLENAAKYTPPGGTVGLSAAVQEDMAVVRVWDTGIGIPADMLGRVFDLFAQGSSASLRREGLGIGLALVRRFVELHGGTVEARSEGVGRGAEFVVRLPLGTPDV